MDHHPIAVEAAGEEFICRTPQVQSKAPVVEFTEVFDNEFTIKTVLPFRLSDRREKAALTKGSIMADECGKCPTGNRKALLAQRVGKENATPTSQGCVLFLLTLTA